MKFDIMNANVKIENSQYGKTLSIYVDSKNKVNQLMIKLADAGFVVDYEPRYEMQNYEGCFLYEDVNSIKVCYKL